MLAACTSESILGGESRRDPLGRWAQRQTGCSDPMLVPRALRATIKGAWQTPHSLALMHSVMREHFHPAQFRPGAVTVFIPVRRGDVTLSWVWALLVLLQVCSFATQKGGLLSLPRRLHSSVSHPLWPKISWSS